ncbi:MAG: hypothetical protein CXZ00_11700 [Acidobacteria bacterium]|nr:MAG: hypothetical protein CXZ00_11700 [Acidobacteriota bacterium]
MSSNPADVSRSGFDRFSRLKALQPRTHLPKPEPKEEFIEPQLSPERSSGAGLLTELLKATVSCNQHGEHLSVITSFGGYAPRTPDSSALHLLLPNAPSEVGDPSQWLFLDTETTGLSGGTGTYPFLVGLAWWEGGGLKVEQLFMREHSEERSMLARVAEHLTKRPVLVTFNGKSFDWPLLETRFRMTRTIAPPPLRAHLDFLHPARNLWRLRLGSVKLSHLERHVLDWDRGEDLLSSEIPRIYLDFVRSGIAEPLLPVFHHNQMDMRGLAGLADRILSILSDEKGMIEDGMELYGLSRICERRGQSERARKIYEQSIGTVLPKETDRAARAALARLAKRDGDFERARELWESLLGNSREGYEAYEQLAIYYEHEVRNFEQALAITREALAQLRRAHKVGMIAASSFRRNKLNFEHRRSRLEGKAERPPDLFSQ